MIKIIVKLREIEWIYIRADKDYEQIYEYDLPMTTSIDLPSETEIYIEGDEDRKWLTKEDKTQIKTLVNNVLFGTYGRRPKKYIASVYKDLSGQNTKYPVELLGTIYYGNA